MNHCRGQDLHRVGSRRYPQEKNLLTCNGWTFAELRGYCWFWHAREIQVQYVDPINLLCSSLDCMTSSVAWRDIWKTATQGGCTGQGGFEQHWRGFDVLPSRVGLRRALCENIVEMPGIGPILK